MRIVEWHALSNACRQRGERRRFCQGGTARGMPGSAIERGAIGWKQHFSFGEQRAQRGASLVIAMHEGNPARFEGCRIGCEFSAVGMRAQAILREVALYLHLLSIDLQGRGDPCGRPGYI